MYVYEQPKPTQDYDVPPSRYPDAVPGSLYNTPSSAKSSREELDQSSFEQSLYDTPPQSRSFRSPDSSMYDTPPSQLHLDPFNIPSSSVRTSLASKLSDESIMSISSGISNGNSKSNSASMCDSARSSLDISPLDMYDVPPTQKEREMRAMYQMRNSKDSGLDMYDSPPKLKSPASMLDDYDVPKLSPLETERAKKLNDLRMPLSEPSSPGSFLEDYDVPKHGRPFERYANKSVENEADLSALDEYDVPKSQDRPDKSAFGKRQRQRSLDTLLDYDTPKPNPQSSRYSMDDNLCSQTVPSDSSFLQKSHNSEISDDENSYDEPDAAPAVKKILDVKPKLEKHDHAVDEDMMYDSPKNNAPVRSMNKEFSALSIEKPNEPKGVYDIPPQVTRDSMMSSKSDSSIISRSDSSDGSEGQRLSQCSIDSRDLDLPMYDELPLDRDAANDLVIKLQQDIQRATSRLSSFVTGSWRKKDNLVQKLDDIRCAVVGVEHALDEFVDFGQGTLANSAKLSDRKLINKLSKYLIPLQQALQQMRVCIKHLDDAEWQIAKLVPQESVKRDDLGQIWSSAKDLNHGVKKLATFIQGNSSLLFKRAKDFQRSSRDSGTLTPSGKPPISRKPPALPTKTLQTRPLPAPPPAERPLPPTPTDKKSQDFSFNGPDTKRFSGEFNKRLSGEFKRQSGEFKHWSGDFQVKRLSREIATPEKEPEGVLPEYDYVQLDDENDSDNCDTLKRVKDSDKKTVNEKKTHTGSHESLLDKVVEVNEKDIANSADTKVKSNNELSRSREKLIETEKLNDSQQEKDKSVITDEVDVNIPERDVAKTELITLDPSDRQVLLFYSEQMETHSTLLTNSIDAFFSCIESSQGPKVFISNSKFVVVSAHKLVYIGDALHHNLQNDEVRSRIIQSANSLCDCLKLTVMATKTAALQYPSVPAVQEMVDRVVDVSKLAQGLKQLVVQAAKL